MLKQRRAKKLAAKSIHLQYKDPFGIRQTGIDIFGDGSQQQDLNMTAGTPILESRVLPGRDGLKSTARNVRSGTPELEQVTSKEWTVARSRFTDKFHRTITECKNDGLKRILRVANRRIKLDKPKRPKFIELDSVKKEVSKWNRSIEPSSTKQQQQQLQRRRNKKIYKKKHVDKILNDNSFIVFDEVYQEPKKVRRKSKVKPTKRVETIIPESPASIRNERKPRKHDTLTTMMDLLEKFVLSDKLHESSPVIVNNYVQSKYFSWVHIFEEYFVDYFEAISKRMLFSVICSSDNEIELIEWIRLVQELQDYPMFKDQVEYFTSKLRIILEVNNLQSHSALATLFSRLLLYGTQDETFLRDLFKKCWSDVSLLAAENAISEDQLELYIKLHDGISIDLIYRMIQEIVKSQDSSMVLNLKRICGYYLLLRREERILELVFDYILKPEIRKTPLDFIKINETVSTIIQPSNQVSPFVFSVIQMNMQSEIPKEEVFSLVENIIFRNDNESECSRLFRSFCQLLFSIPGITCNLYDIAPLVSVHSNNNTISAINERDKLKNWNKIFGKVFGIMKASISNYAVYGLGLLFLGSLSNNVAILKSFFIYFDYLDKIVDYTSELLFVYGICVTVLIKQIVWLNADVSAAVKSHLIEKILKSPKSANFMKTKYYCCILRYVLNEDMILDSLFKQQDSILVKDFLFLLKPSLTTTADHNEDMTVKNSVLQLILALSRKGQLHLGDYFVEFMRELLQMIFSKDQIKDKEQILLLETAVKVVVNIVPSIMKFDLRLFVEKFGPYSNLSGNYGYRNPMFREFSLTVLCGAFRVVSWKGSFDIVYLLRFLAERLVDFLVIEKSSYKSQLIQYISSLQSLLSQKNDYVQLHLGMKPSVDLLTTTSSFEEFLYVFRVLLNFMKTSKSVNVQKIVFGNVLKILLINWKECDGRVWLELNYRKKTFDLLLDLIHSLPTLFSVYELERLLRNNCSGKDKFSDHLYAFWWNSYILTSNIGTELKLLRNLHEFFIYYLITSPTTNNSFFLGFIEALCSKKNSPSSTSVQCELFFNCFLRNWMQNELNLKNAGYFLSILEWFIDKLRLTPEVGEENLSIILEQIVQSFTCIMEYFLSNEIMLSTGFLNYSVQLLCKIVRLNGSLYNFRSELNQSYEFISRFLLYSYAALQEEHAEKAEIMSLCNSFKESRSYESNISRLVSQLELSLKHELSFCPLINDYLGRSMDPCKVYMIPMINLKDRTIYALQSIAALNFTMKLSIYPLLKEMLQDTQRFNQSFELHTESPCYIDKIVSKITGSWVYFPVMNAGYTITLTAILSVLIGIVSTLTVKQIDKRLFNAKVYDERFPWSGNLMRRDKQRAFCGGAFIHPNLMITASHCLLSEDNKPKLGVDHKVVRARRDLILSSDEDGGVDYSVKQFVINQKHFTDSNIPDIGIIYVEADDHAKSQKLPNLHPVMATSRNQDSYDILGRYNLDYIKSKGTDITDKSLVVAGFGIADLSDPTKGRDKLRIIQVQVISNEACIKHYKERYQLTEESFPFSLVGRMCLLTLDGYSQPCEGDSGSPIFYFDDATGLPVIVGLVESTTSACKEGVYTPGTPFFAVDLSYQEAQGFVKSVIDSLRANGGDVSASFQFEQPLLQFQQARGQITAPVQQETAADPKLQQQTQPIPFASASETVSRMPDISSEIPFLFGQIQAAAIPNSVSLPQQVQTQSQPEAPPPSNIQRIATLLSSLFD